MEGSRGKERGVEMEESGVREWNGVRWRKTAQGSGVGRGWEGQAGKEE